MRSRSFRGLVFSAVLLVALAAPARAADRVLGEVALEPATRAERSAGVWVDGQYVGFVEELRGKNRLMLVPGRHELLLKLAGYEDVASTIVVEPGAKHRYELAMRPLAGATYPDEEQTARLRVSVAPERAALFVDGVYAGHVDRFDGRRGLRLRAGTHRVRIALPGYRAFETEVTLLANQTYEIKTELPRGSMSEQAGDLVARGTAE
ncbi:MAG TPA: PEGA domain-containing protein [Gammaproteobacteria bacterium]